MKSLRWWSLAVTAVAAVAALAFASAQQTGALWSQSATISDATINSGTLSLRVGDSGSQSRDFLLSAFGATNLTQNAVVQKPLTVKNAGNVDMKYRLQSVSQSSPDLPLTLKVWIVSSAAGCPAAAEPAGTPLYSGAMFGAQAPAAPAWAPVLPPGDTAVWCLRATVGPTATPNTSATVTLNYLANS